MPYNADLISPHGDSGLVELFDFDATSIGGAIYHLTPYVDTVLFNGVEYNSFPIASMGWELSLSGTYPRPTIQVSNVSTVFLAAIISLGDLVGMRVARFFTFEKYLDGQPEADAGMRSRTEFYYIEQKLQQDAVAITWQLSSPIDRANLVLPKRQYLKDNIAGNVWAPGLSRYRGSY